MGIIVACFCVITVAILVIVAVDAYLVATKGFNATLSYQIMLNSVKYPIIPAAICTVIFYSLGLLTGHLFWSQTLNVTIPCPVSQ